MSSLPPYSTYRTDNKQQLLYPQQLSHGNVLTFTPPGFRQTLNVKFPDCRLAVCEKCKKNYKTRDMCRVRNSHTAEPWTTAYICFTLDDNCTDSEGRYVDKPFAVRMIQWQPYCVRKPFDPKTPVCSACKKTNRTRSFCRERHKHRQLPWCTVYVLLSPADSIDPSTRVAPESTPVPEEQEDATKEELNDDSVAKSGDDHPSMLPHGVDSKGKKKANTGEDSEESDDINDIAESRTFLAKVSCRSISIHWLELAEFDASDTTTVHSLVSPEGHQMGIPGGGGGNVAASQQMDPTQYYAHTMGGYAAQQHQFSLKTHQQYFFHMQQRHQQQYAAQQAAWQAQYNRHSQMQLAATSGQDGSPTVPASPPTQVTAGEAAAQQSKQQQSGGIGGGSPSMAHLAQPVQASEQTAGAAAAAAAAAQQPQARWPQQMVYHQHLYPPQQYQQQAEGGAQQVPQQGEVATTTLLTPVNADHQYQQENGGAQHGDEFGGKVDDIEPAPVHGMPGGTNEPDPKRQRLV